MNEAPPGWNLLVAPLIKQSLKEGIRTFQAKEKFGKLRFYVDGASDELERMISEAESASGSVCEECGAGGRTRNKGGWFRTLCDPHATEFSDAE